MKSWRTLFLCFALWSCNETAEEPQPVSTVDSNLADPNDTVHPELYIDSHAGDTSFTIALDSAGQTILPEDTNYQKRN